MLFTKLHRSEFIFIFITCLLLTTLILLNFRSAKVKSRDQQRKNDLERMYKALDAYNTVAGSFPPAQDGHILACGQNLNSQPCIWGKDDLESLDDEGNRHTHQHIIPQDPRQKDGYTYVYFSDGDQYQILAHLESEKDPEFMPQIKTRNINCGPTICSFGVANSGTALDKSVEEQAKPKDLP